MKVVALKGFYATIGNVKKGDLVDVPEKMGKSLVSAGLARVADKGDTQPVVEPHHPLNNTLPEPETDEQAADQADVEADKEPETGNTDDGEGESSTDVETSTEGETLDDVKEETPAAQVKGSDDLKTTETVATNAKESVKADENINLNDKKASK